MTTIIPAGSFNTSSLQADDLYIQILNPPGFITGVPTDVIGVVGTAAWGPVNQPQHMGNPYDALQTFGPISAAALTDPYDIATDLAIAFGQASSQAVLEAWGVRVTDGTDLAATGAIAGVATSAAELVTLTGTISNGDSYAVTFTQSALVGSPLTLTVNIVTADTLTTAAAKLVTAINGNTALAAIGVFASSVAGVVSIYQPAALSPQVTFTRTSGSSITATLSTGTPSTAGLVLNGIWTGTEGNNITVTVSSGAGSATSTATIALPQLGLSEIYPNLPNATFYTALKNAILQGLSGIRGPSQIVAPGAVNIAVGAPTAGTYTLSGGTDGRTGVVTATLLGSNTAIPPTGLYALQNLSPAVGIVWIVGTTDSTLPASLVSFGRSNGCSVLFPFPTGTSTATALTQVGSLGQHDPSFAYVKDWIYFFDPVNNQTRLVPPTAVIGGMAATLSPEQGWGNKQVNLVEGTERNNPLTGFIQPYSLSEVGQLASAGVIFISNPIPAGATFGTRHGQGTSLQPVTQGMEYWRLTSFLARSLGNILGQFVDEVQTQQPNDPLRNLVRNQVNGFLKGLKGSNGTTGIIDDYTVVCTFSSAQNAVPGNGVNTPNSVASHFLFCLARIRYGATVRFFIMSLQGGTTVITVGSTPGQELQSN